MQPASQIVVRCGGYKVVADWLGLDRSAVQRWTYEKPKGTGGLIPSRHWPALIERAKASGIEISPSDLLPEVLRASQ